MAAQFSRNEKSFKSILDRQADQYPFFCVLLYTPGNGVNARLHKYVRSHWNMLDSLTGDNCLLLAIENMKSELSIDIEKFKPEDVYKIARYLGASVDTVPGLVFFTKPQATKKTLILKVGDFFTDPSSLTDEDLTDFFESIQSIIDKCSGRLKTADQRLKCLSKGLDKKWPLQSRWANIANKVPNLVVLSVTTTATVALAIDNIHTVLLHLLGLE